MVLAGIRGHVLHGSYAALRAVLNCHCTPFGCKPIKRCWNNQLLGSRQNITAGDSTLATDLQQQQVSTQSYSYSDIAARFIVQQNCKTH